MSFVCALGPPRRLPLPEFAAPFLLAAPPILDHVVSHLGACGRVDGLENGILLVLPELVALLKQLLQGLELQVRHSVGASDGLTSLGSAVICPPLANLLL